MTSPNNVKEVWTELLEVKDPWSVHLMQVLCNKMAYIGVPVHLTEVSAECKYISL